MTKIIFTAVVLFFLAGQAIAGDVDSPPLALHFKGEHISTQSLPVRLACTHKSFTLLSGLDAAMASEHVVVTSAGESWQKEMFSLFGYTTSLPASIADKQDARRALELARRENFVAAKIANDEAALKSQSYRASSFFKDMNHFIASSTTPEVLDAGDKGDAYDQWMKLAQTNTATAKTKLGPLMTAQPVRYFVLGNAMDDGIAVLAAEATLCGTEKDAQFLGVVAKIGANSRTKKPQ